MAIRSFEDKTPRLGPGAFVDETALVIGDVALGRDASLWPMAVARGDVHSITIGARTNIQDGAVLHVTHDSEYDPGGHPVVIGDDVTVGHKAILHGCTVEDLCLIGMGAVVLDGAVVRSRIIVAAGGLVPPGKELESGYLWVGQPVRRHRPLTDRELAFLRYSAAHYVQLKDRHTTKPDGG